MCLYDCPLWQERPNVCCISVEGLTVLSNLEDGQNGSKRWHLEASWFCRLCSPTRADHHPLHWLPRSYHLLLCSSGRYTWLWLCLKSPATRATEAHDQETRS